MNKCAKIWVSCINESLSLSLSLQHTAKHWNTLQYTATICLVMLNRCEFFPIVLAATRCNKLRYAALRCSIVIKRVKRVKPLVSSSIVSLSLFLSLQDTAAHYSTLKLHYNTLLHSDELCQALRHALSLIMFNLSESFSVVLAATHVCTVTHFTILQHTAMKRAKLLISSTWMGLSFSLQYTATQCNLLQQTATHWWSELSLCVRCSVAEYISYSSESYYRNLISY